MKIAKKSKTSMLKVANEMAEGLYEANIIDAATMREFDTLCLAPIKKISPEEIKKSCKRHCK